jgi:Tfp pilus assembly protein PilN
MPTVPEQTPSEAATAEATVPVQRGALAVRSPRVNLLPREIEEAARFRRLQLAMGAAVAAAVVIVGGLYYQAHTGVSSAKAQLAAAQARQTQLQSQLKSLANVQNVYTQVGIAKATLAAATSSEIRWSNYLTDLALKMPDNVWLTGISATETAAAPAAAATPALTSTGIGTITFNGVAFKHDDVATWLDVLAQEHCWANPYFSNSTEGQLGTKTVVNFGSSVVIQPCATATSAGS